MVGGWIIWGGGRSHRVDKLWGRGDRPPALPPPLILVNEFDLCVYVSIIDNVLLTLNHCFRTKRISAKNLALGKQLVANLCVDPTVYTHVPQQLGQYVRVHTVLRSVCESLCHNLGSVMRDQQQKIKSIILLLIGPQQSLYVCLLSGPCLSHM